MTKTAAIIIAAGLGGRFLPASKSINKCMMPVMGKPVLQYVIEDAARTDIDKIVVVTSAGDTQTPQHFQQSEALKDELNSIGKGKLYAERVAPMADYSDRLAFVEQDRTLGYGTARGVQAGLAEIDDSYDTIFILNGDGFIAQQPEISGEAEAALQLFNESEWDGMLIGKQVDLDVRDRYGVFLESEDNPGQATQIIEKPDRNMSPHSLLINIGWYILPRKGIEAYLEKTPVNESDNEYYLVEAINLMLKDMQFGLHTTQGEFLDCGTPDNWLAANNFIADNF